MVMYLLPSPPAAPPSPSCLLGVAGESPRDLALSNSVVLSLVRRRPFETAWWFFFSYHDRGRGRFSRKSLVISTAVFAVMSRKFVNRGGPGFYALIKRQRPLKRVGVFRGEAGISKFCTHSCGRRIGEEERCQREEIRDYSESKLFTLARNRNQRYIVTWIVSKIREREREGKERTHLNLV